MSLPQRPMKSFKSYAIIPSLFCDYVMEKLRVRGTELPQLTKKPGPTVRSNRNTLSYPHYSNTLRSLRGTVKVGT